MEKEVNNLVEMLEEEIEWFRNHNNPQNSPVRTKTRQLYTLAKAIQKLQINQGEKKEK